MAHTTRTCRATVLVCMVMTSMVAAVHARGHKAEFQVLHAAVFDAHVVVRDINHGVAQLNKLLANSDIAISLRDMCDAYSGLALAADAFMSSLGEAEDVVLSASQQLTTILALRRSAAKCIERSSKKALAGLYGEAREQIDMALEMFADAKHELISAKKRAVQVARKMKLERGQVKVGVDNVRKEADAAMTDAAKKQRGALGKLAEAGAVGAGLGLVAGPVGQLVGGAAGFGAAAVAVGLAAAFHKHGGLEARDKALQQVQVHVGGVVAVLEEQDGAVARFADAGVAAVKSLVTTVDTVETHLKKIDHLLHEAGAEIIDGRRGGDDRVLQAIMAEYDGVFEKLAHLG